MQRYVTPSIAEITQAINLVIRQFNEFLDKADYPHLSDEDIFVRHYLIGEAVIRVDQRTKYYSFYHGIKISEFKRAALYAYWIVKLQPFVITIRDSETLARREYGLINERFATYIMALAAHIDAPNGFPLSSFDSDYFEKLFYTLHYRNVSIDAIVTLCEGLTHAAFERSFGGEWW